MSSSNKLAKNKEFGQNFFFAQNQCPTKQLPHGLLTTILIFTLGEDDMFYADKLLTMRFLVPR
jgi:hypothetical protein